MKFKKLKAGLLISALTLSSIGGIGTARAQTNAYTTPFTTAVTYQNVGTGSATINLSFYAENTSSTAASISLATLPINAATSIFIGSVTELSAGFTGSGVLSSDQPLVATLVQLPAAASSVKNRPLSNGFSAGSPKILIGTILKNAFSTHSKFSVQNTDTTGVDLTVKFFRAGEATPLHTINVANLPANAAKYFDAATIAELTAQFNGSATVDVVKTGTATPGSAVASVMELNFAGANPNAAMAFEGASTGATTVYMASALCNTFSQDSAYAVQNTSTTTSANVVVTYKATTDGLARSQSATILPNGKHSFLGCGPTGAQWAPFNGSAKITSNVPIIAIGKVSGIGVSTGFLGANAGADRVALPYVRWSVTHYNTGTRTRQRTNITIQNVGAPLAAGTVAVKYYDKTGALLGTHTISDPIPTDGKQNTDAGQIGAAGAEFGYYPDNSTGGSAVVEGPAGSTLVVVGRVSSWPATGLVAEDFSGVEIQ